VYIEASDKVKQLDEFLKKHNLSAKEVMYMGDDIPDIRAMK
jgi:3-deoxy-D-manno-octulosonate 8-phosphate phosphatase (KDO 8-P phosphatase)